MNQNIITNPCENSKSLSTFVENLRNISSKENVDLRTLGHQKAMHLVSKALGFTNWHELKKQMDKEYFMRTMRTFYGMHEQYLDAAWLTLHSSVVDSNVCPKSAAIRYCERFSIKMLPISKMKDLDCFGDALFDVCKEKLTIENFNEVNIIINDLINELYGDNQGSSEVKALPFAEKAQTLYLSKNTLDLLQEIENSGLFDNVSSRLKERLVEIF